MFIHKLFKEGVMNKIRPIDIAARLGISTETLRNYEAHGLVPPIERGANGYRIYTEEHVYYFECIWWMSQGFGMKFTAEVMPYIHRGEVDAVLWRIHAVQAELHQDKLMTDRTLSMLENQALEHLPSHRARTWMTIGEVSHETGVPASAIRYWEKQGLLSLNREENNQYRKFNAVHVRQILLIRTLRLSVWSLDVIKEVLSEFDHQHVDQVKQAAQISLKHLNERSQAQFRGVHALYQLCRYLNLVVA